jgi:hypothetical protein
MAITIQEKFESRQVTMGINPSVELRFHVYGTNNDVDARVALESASPSVYDLYGTGLVLVPRESVSVEPVGPDLWEGVVRYNVVPQENEPVFSFDTGGGTQHITQSLQTVASYAASGTPPNFKGAIAVTDNNVEGVDITVPVYNFSETHFLPGSVVTPSYKATLFNLTGKVNNVSWKGFAQGEVLFLGASGTKRGLQAWEINYRFAASPNKTGIIIGDITGVDKKGWEYLWIRYAETEDATAKALVRRPVAAYVEQVYEYGDFSLLGIGI